MPKLAVSEFEEFGGDPSLKFHPSGGTHFAFGKKRLGHVLLSKLLEASNHTAPGGAIWRGELIVSNREPHFSHFLVRQVRFSPVKNPLSGRVRHLAGVGHFAAYSTQAWIEPIQPDVEYDSLGIHLVIELEYRKGLRHHTHMHQGSDWSNLSDQRFLEQYREIWDIYHRFSDSLE